MEKSIFYINLRNIKNVKQLPVLIKENAAQEVVLLNVSSRVYTLDELLSLNTYNYFWKRDKIRVYVGKHNHLGQPVVAHKLNTDVFKYLFNRDVKPIDVEVGDRTKKMYDLRSYGNNIKSILIAISGWYGFKLHTQTKDVIGQDGHIARDAMGFQLSYTTSEYDQINVLVDKHVGFKVLRPFMKKMVFWKVVGKEQKLVPVRLESIIRYFNEQYIHYINNEYREELNRIKYSIEFSKEFKVRDYARILGIDPTDYKTIDEVKILILNFMDLGYLEYVDTTLSLPELLNVAETYSDKNLAIHIVRLLLAGKLRAPASEEFDLNDYSILRVVGAPIEELKDLIIEEELFGNEDYRESLMLDDDDNIFE